MVTAQKRAESLDDVPITISALSAENLEDFGVDNLFEVANLVPGVVFSRAPDDGLSFDHTRPGYSGSYAVVRPICGIVFRRYVCWKGADVLVRLFRC